MNIKQRVIFTCTVILVIVAAFATGRLTASSEPPPGRYTFHHITPYLFVMDTVKGEVWRVGKGSSKPFWSIANPTAVQLETFQKTSP